jgi:hypothetical protein
MKYFPQKRGRMKICMGIVKLGGGDVGDWMLDDLAKSL